MSDAAYETFSSKFAEFERLLGDLVEKYGAGTPGPPHTFQPTNELRDECLEALRHFDETDFRRLLQEQFEEPSSALDAALLSYIGLAKDAHAVAPLTELLEREPRIGKALASVDWQGRVLRIVFPYVRRLEAETQVAYRSLILKCAVRALGLIGDRRGIEPTARLLSSPDAAVRAEARRALERMEAET